MTKLNCRLILTLTCSLLALIQLTLAISSISSILRHRGYLTKDYYITTQHNKYLINLVRATNPLINKGLGGLPGKLPLLLIHGFIQNSKSFILDHDKVSPRDYSQIDVNHYSTKSLLKLLEGDQGARSIAFTALNFGYEVWFMNRRSANDSHLLNSPADNSLIAGAKHLSDFWNFSWDEQANFDVPKVVDFVLEKSKKPNLSVVGYSSACALLLMAHTKHPSLARKISKTLLWSPYFDQTNGFFPGLIDKLVIKLLPILSKLETAIISPRITSSLNARINVICSRKEDKPLLCNPLFDFAFGPGSSQSKLELLGPNKFFDGTSLGEILIFFQAAKKGLMHEYDRYDARKNLRSIKKIKPEVYHLSKIRSKNISFWLGTSDTVADIADAQATRQRLSVPSEEIIIKVPGWNHIAPILHKKNTEHIILPSLKMIDQS